MIQFERFDSNEESHWYGIAKNTPYCLDFLYFFVGAENLATNEKFSKEYLDYLKKNWQIEKEITNNDILKFPNSWYAFTSSKKDFLKLSSKLELTKILKSWNAYQHQVYTGVEFELDLQKKWYLKSDFGFAGRGNKILELNGKSKFQSTQAVVVEEYLERKIDFSILLLEKQKYLIYQNRVSSSGQYQESIIDFANCHDIEKFLKHFNISNQKILEFKSLFLKLTQHFNNLGSFDFFIYQSNGDLFIHPCCEFNPRWTMGRVAWTIASRFNKTQAKLFKAGFSKQALDGHQILSPENAKVKYQVKWYN